MNTEQNHTNHEHHIRIHKKVKRLKYKNIAIFFLTIIVLVIISRSPYAKDISETFSTLGYFSVFIAGFFYVSTFTIAPSAVLLFMSAQHLNPILSALVAGFGSMLGDYVMFRFFKDKLFEEIKPILKNLPGKNFNKILHSPFFIWLAPVLGAILIASPVPDEVGISLLGVSKLKNWQFLLLTFCLDTIGLLAIISISRVLQ